jgi:uncharacterized membrane protein
MTKQASQTPSAIQITIYVFILIVAALWCAGILLAPLFAAGSGFSGEISAALYNFFSASCHQQADRSHSLLGYKLGVCSRCTAIYFGFLIAVVVFPFVRKLSNPEMPSLWVLFAGVFLIVIDAGLDIFGLWENTFFTRDLSGLILGVILAFFIVPGSERLAEEIISSRRIKRNQKSESAK